VVNSFTDRASLLHVKARALCMPKLLLLIQRRLLIYDMPGIPVF
jgi:hypothetical protein